MVDAPTGEPPCECDPSTCYVDCSQRHICRWQREQIDYWAAPAMERLRELQEAAAKWPWDGGPPSDEPGEASDG